MRTKVAYITTFSEADLKAPLCGFLREADRLLWSDVAQCMRVAGDIVTNESRCESALAYRRVYVATAAAEIAKARQLIRFIASPDMRKRARIAVNKMAACVNAERG